MNTIVFEDAQALVHGAADHLAALITAAPSPRVSVGLAGGSTPAAIYVQLRERDVDWSRVDFWLDNHTMSGTPTKVEREAPFDFKGGTLSTANPWDTTTVADGTHTISAKLYLSDGTTKTISSSFSVNNAA